ncbi:antibiotic biosynthesis monooxygenase [Bacteroidetes bacterium UKL13-3]|jgi:heme-degrading monooxygenase HmoA|nr:antibiotic biosynthesis monooxygenase [Bacteroidetes bacterium UKL13-3]HCP93700.1 antibiotic biosynthesis monooxygenase [Bacteroidota bacterium]
MINRIVRMTFDSTKLDEFIQVFNNSKQQIALFPGCHGLKLLQDANEKNVYYTYSLWLDDESLQRYRRSDLFKVVWASTRALFSDKPQAWSTTVIYNVK